MNIRRASEGDLDALLRLYEQLSPSNAHVDGAKAQAALAVILRREGLELLVAEAAGAVVGTVTLVIVPSLTHDSRPWAQLENMVTDASVRGTRVGRALVEECLRIAREGGCYKVQLQSAEHRTAAHRFYERMGFTDSSAGFRRYLE